jgi:hypothetical protein
MDRQPTINQTGAIIVLQDFEPGDFLIFQLESAFALLRILAIDENGGDTVWHVAGYNEFFPDIESADAALELPGILTIRDPHIALTNRAFESTQVARMKNVPLNAKELKAYEEWKRNPAEQVSDRSVRLMLGFR